MTKRILCYMLVLFLGLFCNTGCGSNMAVEQPSTSVDISTTTINKGETGMSTTIRSISTSPSTKDNISAPTGLKTTGTTSGRGVSTTSTSTTVSKTSQVANTTTATTTKPVKPKEDTEIGIWYSTWYGYTNPGSSSNIYDTWNAWSIEFKPLLPDGTFGYYDSSDTTVIDYHLRMMSQAQIDFIIMDQTNNIDADGGYINNRSIAVAKQIKKYNDSGARPIRYCSAIGGIQWSHDAATIENEAKMLWTRYNSQEFGGMKYHYYYLGKPVLVVYGDGARTLWEAYTGDKTYASKFTIRWADNQSVPGNWGWAYDKGIQWHHETTVVMPGWHNRVGHTPVNRNYGETYRHFWNTILNKDVRPRIIVINSFNEYAERTAVFPANGSDVSSEGDKWYVDNNKVEDPYMYWNMTVKFIKDFKAMDKPLAYQEG